MAALIVIAVAVTVVPAAIVVVVIVVVVMVVVVMVVVATVVVVMVVVVWWLFPRMGRFLDNVRPFAPCLCLFLLLLLFFQVEISSRTLSHSLCLDQSTVAQRAEATVAECFLTGCG